MARKDVSTFQTEGEAAIWLGSHGYNYGGHLYDCRDDIIESVAGGEDPQLTCWVGRDGKRAELAQEDGGAGWVVTTLGAED